MFDKFMNDFVLAFLIENKTQIIFGTLFLANEVLEYYLGKTEKVEAGSKLELILLIIKKIKSVFSK